MTTDELLTWLDEKARMWAEKHRALKGAQNPDWRAVGFAEGCMVMAGSIADKIRLDAAPKRAQTPTEKEQHASNA